MAIIYGNIGSLDNLLFLLKKERINLFSSLNEIISFKENYETKIAEIKKEVENNLYIEGLPNKVNIMF